MRNEKTQGENREKTIENLKRILNIVKEELSEDIKFEERFAIADNSAVKFCNRLKLDIEYFEELFFGENHLIYKDPGDEHDYVCVFIENQGVYSIWLHKDQLEMKDPLVYFSETDVHGVYPQSNETYSEWFLDILHSFN